MRKVAEKGGRVKLMKYYGRLFFVIILCVGCSQNHTPEKLRFPVVYVDMDGTTLDNNHEIRAATLRAFQKFKSCGGRLGIATGRPWKDIQSYVAQVQPNMPIIILNGGLIYDAKENIIDQSPLSDEAVHSTLAAAKKLRGINAVFLVFAESMYSDRDNDFVKAFVIRDKTSVQKTCPDLEECLHDSSLKQKPIKISFVVDPPLAKIVAESLQARVGSQARAVIESQTTAFLSVIPPTVDKITALKKILPQQGLSVEDMVYFGDSQNDARALAAASLGVAMGNCHPDSCQAAAFVTGSNETDSIANVMERVVMREGCR